MTDAHAAASPDSPSRRRLLSTLALGIPAFYLTSAWLLPAGPLHAQTAAPAPVPATFLDTVHLLTGHAEVDARMGDAVWSALLKRQPDFAERYVALHNGLQQAGITTFAQVDGTAGPLAADPLRGTAMSIISACYLGRVGEIAPRADVGPVFVSYVGALMWRPTLDATVLPTFARGGPGHWAKPPSTLATD
jgi:hypothetical protein